MSDSRLKDLMLRWEEDALSDEELQELTVLLEQEGEARRELVHHFMLSTEISRRLAPGPAAASPDRLLHPRRRLHRRGPAPVSRVAPILIAAGLLAGIAAFIAFLMSGASTEERTARGAEERPDVSPAPAKTSPPMEERTPDRTKPERSVPEGKPGPTRERRTPLPGSFPTRAPEREVPRRPERAGTQKKPVEAVPEPSPPTKAAIASLERLEGEVFILEESLERPAREGQPILAGQGVRAGGRATLVLRDGTRIELDPGTAVREIGIAQGTRFRLDRGLLSAEVMKQPRGMPLVFTTAHAEATVLGTTLRLAVSETSTRLDVSKGRVRLKRLKDGRSVIVQSGHYAVAGAGIALRSRPLARLALFEDDFQSSPADVWPKGWKRHHTGAATRSGFAVIEEPGNRFMGCPQPPGGTQHAFIPLDSWERRFTVTFRLRLGGPRNDRAGIEFEDRDDRQHPTFEYDARAQMLRALEKRPTGRKLKEVPLKLAPGRWSAWKVSVDGKIFRLSVDGKPLLQVQMDRSDAIKTASLISRGADSAHFDDVRVAP